MSVFVAPTVAEQARLTAEMDRELMDLIDRFSKAHGISGLSVMTLILMSTMIGLKTFGGPSCRPFALAVLGSLFHAGDKDQAKRQAEANKAMRKMGAHYDLLVAPERGSA